MLITPEFLLEVGFWVRKEGALRAFDVFRIEAPNGEGMEIEESLGKSGWAFRPLSGGAIVGGWPRLLTQQAEVRAIAGLLEIVLK